jgi:tetratricopeptide (TPR) repeat protein
MKLLLLIISLAIPLVALKYWYKNDPPKPLPVAENVDKVGSPIVVEPKVEKNVFVQEPGVSKILPSTYHVYQSFNNCGPAALSMTLHHYGITKTQQELGLELRPYQNVAGDNDDKSVTMEELALKSKEYGFTPYFRPVGSIELVKKLITYDIPVITKTWLTEDEDIGHFRIIKGYDDTTLSLIQDDSYQGPNLWYTYDSFNAIWKKFNYEFLILVPEDKLGIVKVILGELEDEDYAWKKAAELASQELETDPNDTTARFNLVVALYRSHRYSEAVEEFEKIQTQLPFRTLWYQTEPIKAYYELGQYDKVLELTDSILTTGNRAFSELYLLRGKAYLKQEDVINAKKEFELALLYNVNLLEARRALDSVQESPLE